MRDDYYKIAEKRVRKKRNFYKNLASWLIVSAFLFAINALTSTDHWWAVYPFIGWGMGVAFQGFEAFSWTADKEREQEMIMREMQKMEDEGRYLDDGLDDDELELKEIQKEKRWDDKDFV
jgi:hypothetical protein